MKLKKEDIDTILTKAVEAAVGAPEVGKDNKDDDRMAKIEKAVAAVTAQISSLSTLAANGFEKPKTLEEQVAEMGKSIEDKILKALGKPGKKVKKLKKDTDEDADKDKDEDVDKDKDKDKDEDKDDEDADKDKDDTDKDKDEDDTEGLPETKEELGKMIKKAVTAALKKIAIKGKAKGKGKDGLEKEASDDDDKLMLDGIEISEDLRKETHDAAGNELSKQQRIDRARLDNFFGKKIGKHTDAADDEEVEFEFEDEK